MPKNNKNFTRIAVIFFLLAIFVFCIKNLSHALIGIGIFDKHISILRFWDNLGGLKEKWLVINSDTKPHKISAVIVKLQDYYEPGTDDDKIGPDHPLATISDGFMVGPETYKIFNAQEEMDGLPKDSLSPFNYIGFKKDIVGIGIDTIRHEKPVSIYMQPGKVYLTKRVNGGDIYDSWIEMPDVIQKSGTQLTAVLKLLITKSRYSNKECKHVITFPKIKNIGDAWPNSEIILPKSINSYELKRNETDEEIKITIPWSDATSEPLAQIDIKTELPSVSTTTLFIIPYTDTSCFLENKRGSGIRTSIPLLTTP